MHFKKITLIVSNILLFGRLLFLLCFPYAIYSNEQSVPFLIPALIVLAIGFFIYAVSNKKFSSLASGKEALLLILISWVMMIVIGTLPYFFSRTIPSGIDVIFETISGITTTGTSVLPNVEQLPKSILFWRSLSQWLGGIATIAMVIALMPSLNFGGNRLFSQWNRCLKKKTSLI